MSECGVEGITKQLAARGLVFNQWRYKTEMKVAQEVMKETGKRIALRIAELGRDRVL
jgi:hypothetical protein